MSLARQNPGRAITLKLGSVFLFVVMASLIKAASVEVPPGEAVFFRSFFAIPVIVAWLAWRGDLATGLRTVHPMGHVWRGVIGSTAMGLGFAGLAILPLTEVKAIGYAMPIFVVVLALIFLNERIRLVRIGAVGMGLAGVLVILWPRLSAFSGENNDPALTIGALIVLAGAFCAAMAQVLVRKLVETEETSAIVFWFSVTASSLSLLSLPFGWVVPSYGVAGMLVMAGLIGGVGQILLTSAYRYGDASIIAPFEYASILFAVVIGLVFFEETPARTTLAGAALVIAAGGLIIWRERQLKLRRGRARHVVTRYG
ncbi:MAG: DMT family transporter [Pseudomonadota bacterium]